MNEILLAGPRHRMKELDSMAERFKEVPDTETISLMLHDGMTFTDIRKLIQSTYDANMVVVTEEYTKDRAVKSPFMAVYDKDHRLRRFLMKVPSLQELVYSHLMRFNVITAIILCLAEQLHKDVIILPWRGDEGEEPSYLPPNCWLDKLSMDNIYYYE